MPCQPSMTTLIRRLLVQGLLGLWLLATSLPTWAAGDVNVYAAASTTNAINDIGALYEKEKSVKITTSFAASSVLAKQIEEGAPAGIFISADLKWMDYLQEKGKLVAGTRRHLLGNQLVMIAPRGKGFPVKMDKTFAIEKAFEGKWCTGDPVSVPVGNYAKQALTALGWWQTLEPRLGVTQDVRAALAFVERGECAMGIVYETDAKVSDKVTLLGAFPPDTHQPVVYPIALIEGADKEAQQFLAFLFSKPAADIFTRYGFTVLGQ